MKELTSSGFPQDTLSRSASHQSPPTSCKLQTESSTARGWSAKPASCSVRRCVGRASALAGTITLAPPRSNRPYTAASAAVGLERVTRSLPRAPRGNQKRSLSLSLDVYISLWRGTCVGDAVLDEERVCAEDGRGGGLVERQPRARRVLALRHRQQRRHRACVGFIEKATGIVLVAAWISCVVAPRACDRFAPLRVAVRDSFLHVTR